jgi:carboxymethylenebutenolidase
MKIDPRLVALYDEYCHSEMSRREFLTRAGAITLAAGALGCGSEAAPPRAAEAPSCPDEPAADSPQVLPPEAMLPDYDKAQTVNFNDPRIDADYLTYDSPGGNGGKMRGYLVAPKAKGPFGAVLVVHENRGLNPYVEDVARRVALAGYLALAPDALFSVGGYPGNDDDGKALQRGLDGDKILVDMINSARLLKGHASSNGKLGVTGFCFGGGVSNDLAARLGDELSAAAPFYGRAPALEGVPKIKAQLTIHYAEDDERVNATRPAYEGALKKAGVPFESHTYPGTLHGFHNDSTPRFHPEQAKLAWKRTIELFEATLGPPRRPSSG